MLDAEARQDHPTGDEALTNLSNVKGPVGEFAKNYPGRTSEDDSGWLDSWFIERTNGIMRIRFQMKIWLGL